MKIMKLSIRTDPFDTCFDSLSSLNKAQGSRVGIIFYSKVVKIKF